MVQGHTSGGRHIFLMAGGVSPSPAKRARESKREARRTEMEKKNNNEETEKPRS